MVANGRDPLAKGVFWTSVALYGLVALEFFYMASPFAAYIYSAYGPVLSWLRLSETTTWLVAFFLPHIVRETGSPMLDLHEIIGAVVFMMGLAGFTLGAVPIYWSKLTHRRVIVGGVYRWIRHPQYLALMVASLGMLLLWPRYLVVVGFITVCFTYVLLARVEERACARDFPDYAAYAERTGMFLPRGVERLLGPIPWPRRRLPRIGAGVAVYTGLMAVGLLGACALHGYAVMRVDPFATETEAYVSVGRLHPDTIAALAETALGDPEVREALADHDVPDARFINYVMPTSLFVSEVPMVIPPGSRVGHEAPSAHDPTRYKIVFTRAHFGAPGPAAGRAILLHAINKSPVIEVWVDRTAGTVERVLRPPREERYHGLPVPVF
jgi:protein-S-isoprenylcysteine O-methyltransferase Ste14